MSWTDERISLLRKLWGEGRTAAEIAKELGGVSRNAVIGKAHRLRLSNRASPIQQNNKKPVRTLATDTPKIVIKPVTTAARVVIKGKGVKLIDLRDRMCRWPVGDPKDADFVFCGCDAVPGLPYCEDHARAAYQPAARSGSRLVNPDDVDSGRQLDSDEADDAKEAVA